MNRPGMTKQVMKRGLAGAGGLGGAIGGGVGAVLSASAAAPAPGSEHGSGLASRCLLMSSVSTGSRPRPGC